LICSTKQLLSCCGMADTVPAASRELRHARLSFRAQAVSGVILDRWWSARIENCLHHPLVPLADGDGEGWTGPRACRLGPRQRCFARESTRPRAALPRSHACHRWSLISDQRSPIDGRLSMPITRDMFTDHDGGHADRDLRLTADDGRDCCARPPGRLRPCRGIAARWDSRRQSCRHRRKCFAMQQSSVSTLVW
jgi:hypothetical protein